MRRLRQSFTRALLTGDPKAAERAVRRAIEGGMTAAEIDVELIAPALFTIGEKWALGEITVADEHLATEIALRVLALQREARRAVGRRLRRTVLLLAPEGERHVVGLNMAHDLLYAAGYDTRLLGADVPLTDIAYATARHKVDVVAFTATMSQSAERIDAAIDYLQAAETGAEILLGGKAVSFELAATWNATVCADLPQVVACVDGLIHRSSHN